jgi:hypothetical protein
MAHFRCSSLRLMASAEYGSSLAYMSPLLGVGTQSNDPGLRVSCLLETTCSLSQLSAP